MHQMVDELETKARRAREATRSLAFLPTSLKNRALRTVAAALGQHADRVIAANAQDYEEAKASGMNAAMLDRLLHRSVVVTLDGASYRLRHHATAADTDELRRATTGTNLR